MKVRISFELEVDDDVRAREVQAAAFDGAWEAAAGLESVSRTKANVTRVRVSIPADRRMS